jgi:hypothetical protein
MNNVINEMMMGAGAIAGKDMPMSKPVNCQPSGKFRGHNFFDCEPATYDKARFGKNRYHRWDKYVGKDSWGEGVRGWAKSNPKEPILLRNKSTGTFMYLRSPQQQF